MRSKAMLLSIPLHRNLQSMIDYVGFNFNHITSTRIPLTIELSIDGKLDNSIEKLEILELQLTDQGEVRESENVWALR